MITDADIQYIMRNGKTRTEKPEYTWDDVMEIRDRELEQGQKGCPIASMLSLLLMMPKLNNSFYKAKNSYTKNNMIEDFDDYSQSVYLIISKHIADYDKNNSQNASFITYLSKWLQEVLGNMSRGGISHYQYKEKNIRIMSYNAPTNNQNANDDNEPICMEFEDPNADVASIYENNRTRRNIELMNQLFDTTMTVEQLNDENYRTKAFQSFAAENLLLGGFNNLPDTMLNYIKEHISDYQDDKNIEVYENNA